MDGPEWMSSKAAAAYLGISQRTMYKLIDEGQVPGYQLGRVIRLQRPELDAFIEASRVQPGSLRHLYPNPPSMSGDAPDEDDEPRPG
jgi:excisionase family DNA binding protein